MCKHERPFYPVLIIHDEGGVLWGNNPDAIAPAWLGVAHPAFNEAAQFSQSLRNLNQ